MKRRLGPWKRLGIVLTAFWLVGGTIYFANVELNSQFATRGALLDICYRSIATDRPRDCMADALPIHADIAWEQGLALTAVLALLAWIAFGILYGSARWILAGRKQEEKPE